MTSNVGARDIAQTNTMGFSAQGAGGLSDKEINSRVMSELKRLFRPEFLNRLDEIIMFKPLTKQNIGGIVDLLLQETNKRLADQEISIELTPAAKQYVADEGYDPAFGARPLKRFLQKHVETLAAKLILSSDSGLHKGAVIRMDVDEKKGGLKAEVVA